MAVLVGSLRIVSSNLSPIGPVQRKDGPMSRVVVPSLFNRQ